MFDPFILNSQISGSGQGWSFNPEDYQYQAALVPVVFVDDAQVNNSQSSSGNNSLYFLGTGASGGPQDILFMFDTTQNITIPNLGTIATPYVSGIFTFSQMMMVRNGGYLNFKA